MNFSANTIGIGRPKCPRVIIWAGNWQDPRSPVTLISHPILRTVFFFSECEAGSGIIPNATMSGVKRKNLRKSSTMKNFAKCPTLNAGGADQIILHKVWAYYIVAVGLYFMQYIFVDCNFCSVIYTTRLINHVNSCNNRPILHAVHFVSPECVSYTNNRAHLPSGADSCPSYSSKFDVLLLPGSAINTTPSPSHTCIQIAPVSYSSVPLRATPDHIFLGGKVSTKV